ncbi:hypothetical protein IAG41_11425 [Sphingomonas sp. JC676]|uniref:hypothetical protein n=1 Tax=Sphingomonas sp. JC676 TaxID=2768065 RepID=UPI001657F035|nr:hypothetical protein [Sphingomonas sp. JC676]MBC9033006.1 hypothetical protein [Sphingomonas sp. JC676]
MRRVVASILGLVGVCAASAAIASETVTYTYDAKGRLVKVVRTGTVNNNVTYDYTQDKANNRTNVKVTNSPNAPPP